MKGSHLKTQLKKSILKKDEGKKKQMKAEDQCYSDSSPGVPGGGIGRWKRLLPAGDICMESRCSVGSSQSRHCAKDLY